MYRSIVIAVLLLIGVFAPAYTMSTYSGGYETTSANIIVVPRDYPTIQDAVNAARPGTIIIVKSGYYRERVDIIGKYNITIRGKGSVTIKSSTEGIYIESSQYIKIENLVISASYYGVVIKNSQNIVVKNVSAKDYLYAGIEFYSSSNVEITECRLTYFRYQRVAIDGSGSNVVISRNYIYSMTGIQVGGVDVTIVGNTIVDLVRDYYGIYIGIKASFTDGVIANNKIIGSSDGCTYSIYVNGRNIVIRNNTILNAFYGVYVTGASNITLINNSISVVQWYSYGYALQLGSIYGSPSDVAVIGNYLDGKRGYAVGAYKASNIVFYLNTIIGKLDITQSSIQWYSSSPVNYTYRGRVFYGYLGNYWTNYQGTDRGLDGVGDTGYNTGFGIDEYPLNPIAVARIQFINSSFLNITLTNGSSILTAFNSLQAYHIEGQVFAGYSVEIDNERYVFEYPAKYGYTIYMNSTDEGFEIASTSLPLSIDATYINQTHLRLSIILDEPGILSVYVPENYLVLEVYKDGVPSTFSFNETSRCLELDDPVNVTIVMLDTTRVNATAYLSINGSYALEEAMINWTLNSTIPLSGTVKVYINDALLLVSSKLSGATPWIPTRCGFYNVTVKYELTYPITETIYLNKTIYVDPRPLMLEVKAMYYYEFSKLKLNITIRDRLTGNIVYRPLMLKLASNEFYINGSASILLSNRNTGPLKITVIDPMRVYENKTVNIWPLIEYANLLVKYPDNITALEDFIINVSVSLRTLPYKIVVLLNGKDIVATVNNSLSAVINGLYVGDYNLTIKLVTPLGSLSREYIIHVRPRPVNLTIEEFKYSWVNKTHARILLKAKVVDALTGGPAYGEVTLYLVKGNETQSIINLYINGALYVSGVYDPYKLIIMFTNTTVYGNVTATLYLKPPKPRLTPPPLIETPYLPLIVLVSMLLAIMLIKCK